MFLGAAVFLRMIEPTMLLFFVSSSSEKQGMLDDKTAFYLVALLNIG